LTSIQKSRSFSAWSVITRVDGEIVDKIIEKALRETVKVTEDFVSENARNLSLLSERIASAFTGDRKLMICGNGGSAADAQHIAAEFVNRFILERPPLPAIALTTDTSIITSIGNDYSFDEIFSKQVKALGMEGDVLLVISTSGNSRNVISAVKAARSLGMYTVALTGRDGGSLSPLVDMALVVKHNATPRIQEAHQFALHVLCQLVDYILFQHGSQED
jgi:D-sedoheptulose 7-phosphate isomerase